MKNVGKWLSLACLLATTNVFATTYTVPSADQVLIGKIKYTTVESDDTAGNFAHRYDIGYNALGNANPHVDLKRGLPAGSQLQLPTQHLLPNEERKGIVVNLPEMRMYYYLPGKNNVLTYPIGVGKIGKTIPITKALITKKVENPTWSPPLDIREFNLAQGIIVPKVMPAGPDNPLGPFAVYMTIPTFLIHSTIFPESIGKRLSFGCIRLYESDIREFFPVIQSGEPVVIINKPVKLGWQQDHLYMEAYEPLEEYSEAYDANLPGMVHEVVEMTKNQDTLIDWQLVSYISTERDGIPHEVGMKLPV